MAAARAKVHLPVGSAQWIQSERDQASQFVDQEVEEFGFSARNEMEWLNEHMAEIFSANPMNFADVFKTPGKLRGKTPKTARKRDPLAARAPLTDLFAPNPQSIMSPAQNTTFYNRVAQFKIAEDGDSKRAHQDASRKSPPRVGKDNTDSGYHGIPEDEMEVDSQQSAAVRIAGADPFRAPAAAAPALETLEENTRPAERSTNDIDSFVSANEDLETAKDEVHNNDDRDDDATVPDDEMQVDVENAPNPASSPLQRVPVEDQHDESGNWQVEDEPEPEPVDAEEDLDVKSPSDVYSPEKPLLRKSSLNFAALPAREPLTAKRSIGPRGSHVDAFAASRNSVLGRQTHGKSFGASQQPIDLDEQDDNDDELEEDGRHDDQPSLQNKSSTQTLHERIAALGQTKEPRMSKSIPMSLANSGYPVLPKEQVANARDHPHNEDDDDDWIAPIEKTSRPASGVDEDMVHKAVQDRSSPAAEPVTVAPLVRHSPSKYLMGYQKSSSTISLASPGKSGMAPESLHKKAISISNPNLSHALGTSTPMSSPGSKKFADGPLSASKARLYSVLKSAKGIFASSAGASAQAKMDASSSPVRAQQGNAAGAGSVSSRMPGGFDDIPMAPKPAERPIEGRKTRSSTENEKKKDRAMDDLERVRQKERQKAAEQKLERERLERVNSARQEKERLEAASRAESQRSATDDQSETDETAPPPPPKSMLPAGKLRAPGRLARPTKPASSQAKPAPQLIRVASQSQRLGPVQPSGTAADATPAATTRGAATRAGSAQPTTSKAAPVSAARVRALEAAARKKEQDEKAAQRKVEQKRELERKRAAKAEEEKRAEQERKAAEQQRLQEAKLAEQQRIQESRLAAQRQAEQRKLEQQRLQAAQEKARVAELAAALEQEKREKLQAQASYPRGDIGGTLRQLAKQEVARPVPSSNQAKSSKRALADAEDEPQQRPGLQRGPPSYQQQDNKRRKTLEDDDDSPERHSVMAPPKRPSNMRKETFSKFPNGYTHAPPPAAHHAQNMYKATITAQHQMQHGPKAAPMHPNDMLKLSNARIPFADNTNPPGPSSSSNTAHYVQDGAAKPGPSAFKTPGRPASAAPKSAVKSSPMYQNGENIALPEIATDSEDESDSDDENATGGFRAPSWVASPALRDLLTSQQLVDPESVFGPIASLNMDEVFKNGKNAERLKRFRDRGSSARWVESGDAVTQEEKKRDREARARVVREGGWRFGQDSG